MPEIPFCEVAFHPEYKALGTIVGQGKLKAEHWPTWARIVALYGWRNVLRASEYLEPEKRWPAEVETLCRQYQRDDLAEEREAKERHVRDTPVSKTSDEDYFRIWLPYYVERGSYSPAFKRLAERLGRTLP